MFSRKSKLFTFAFLLLLITGCASLVPISSSNTNVNSDPSTAPTFGPMEAEGVHPSSVNTPISSAPTEVPTILPIGIPDKLYEVKTYRDELAGFVLNYPAAWYIEDDALKHAAESFAYTVSLFSWDRTSAAPSKNLNTLPDGATKIDITVFNQRHETIAEAVDQFRAQDGETLINFLRKENWVLSNGQAAIYLESEGAFGVVGTMITLVKNRTVYISGYGNLALFEAIALTLYAE